MSIEIVAYDPRYKESFAALNREWIERYFAIEPEDEKSLGDPEGYVLRDGGEIFFAVSEGEAVGTVAMVVASPGVFELAKMAVAPQFQGRGISRLLMASCIEFARSRAAAEIFLVTNSALAPAMGLYLRSGFVVNPDYHDPRYTRGDTEMRLSLACSASARQAPAEIEKL